MPARPIAPETLQLIDAVREALAESAGAADVTEKRMFGCHVFMVNEKICLGVKHDELLVRLPPEQHAQQSETPGLRPLSPAGGMNGYFLISPAAYATRAAWQQWIAAALAFNPLARATPKKRKKAEPLPPPGTTPEKATKPAPRAARKTHPIFDSE